MYDHRDYQCRNCNSCNTHETEKCPEPPQAHCTMCQYTKDLSKVVVAKECDKLGRYFCPHHEPERVRAILLQTTEVVVKDTKLPGGSLSTTVEFLDGDSKLHQEASERILKGGNEGLGVDFNGAITGLGVKKSMAEPKLPMGLIPPLFLRLVAEVLKYGAKKYAPNNWLNGMSWEEVLAGVMRHIQAFREGEEKDPETGLPHLAHAACGLMFLLWYSAGPRNNEYRKFDDRLFKTNPQPEQLDLLKDA